MKARFGCRRPRRWVERTLWVYPGVIQIRCVVTYRRRAESCQDWGIVRRQTPERNESGHFVEQRYEGGLPGMSSSSSSFLQKKALGLN